MTNKLAALNFAKARLVAPKCMRAKSKSPLSWSGCNKTSLKASMAGARLAKKNIGPSLAICSRGAINGKAMLEASKVQNK